MKIIRKWNKKALYTSVVFAFLMITGFIEVFSYPNLDTTFTLQGYETMTLLGMFFGIHWLVKAWKGNQDTNE